jgi:cob(I)alamin adenosyltransferase
MNQEYTIPLFGMLHVYTGDGKGKTTSSIGLCVRAASADKKVLFIQFDKGPHDDLHYSERKMLFKMENVTLIPTGCNRRKEDGTFRFGVEQSDLDEAERGLREAHAGIESTAFGLVILDEIVTSVTYNLIKREDLQKLIDLWTANGKKHDLILTGRGADNWLIDQADLVTEMKKIKHYFDKGFLARKGIEF